MAIKYTETKEGIIEYIDKMFEEYLCERKLNEEELEQTQQRFREERAFVNMKLESDSEYSGALWMAIFLGKWAKKNGIIVRNHLVQCPFIMYLLHLASYNVLEEGFLKRPYLYLKSNISFYDYYISHNFYEMVREDIEEFFADTGYTYMWVGQESANIRDLRTASGIVIFPVGETAINYRGYCGRLLDKRVCILEEYVPEIEENCREYRFRIGNDLSIDEELFLNYFRPDNKKDIINIFAYAQTIASFEDPDLYYKQMITKTDPIFTREDLWICLRMKGLSEERAYYWSEIIRKGRLKRIIEEDRVSLAEWQEVNGVFGEKFINLLCMVKYLPSKWSVVERFYQCC